jgi:hypothetical protein
MNGGRRHLKLTSYFSSKKRNLGQGQSTHVLPPLLLFSLIFNLSHANYPWCTHSQQFFHVYKPTQIISPRCSMVIRASSSTVDERWGIELNSWEPVGVDFLLPQKYQYSDLSVFLDFCDGSTMELTFQHGWFGERWRFLQYFVNVHPHWSIRVKFYISKQTEYPRRV